MREHEREGFSFVIDQFAPGHLARGHTTYTLDADRPPAEGQVLTLSPRAHNALEIDREQIVGAAEDGGVFRLELKGGAKLDILRPEQVSYTLLEQGEASSYEYEALRDELMGPAGEMAFTALSGGGSRGESVTVSGEVSHAGAEQAQVYVREQEGAGREQSLTLDLAEWRAQERFTAEVEIPWYWDAGALSLELVIEGAQGQRYAESLDLAHFEDERDRDLQWQFSDPFEAPLAGVGRVFAEHDGGSGQIGTGFLISPEHVLTSAHVLSATEWGADFDSLDSVGFALAEDGRLADGRGAERIEGERIHWSTDQWGGGQWPSGDLALIELDKPLEAPTFEPFWNAADEPERDLVGEPVRWAGFPTDGIDQGDEADYRWEASGIVSGYAAGSGALELSAGLAGAGGASGSPVFYEDGGDYYAAGVFAGASNGSPVAANLDDKAFNWALEIVQAGGYLSDLDEAQPLV
ncbi:serine protease [Halorhodospira halochloris]|uniref:trypsin-like serine peptidase n=1 Tax=Halorhodospira halochloris TaxID=1052 RepID=UPI001EE931C4|nr:trypsin-like peptidase domain-containing protein [Halorhodospira halochloris]MCG5531695.1 serine protease [Halorhodospira halochloris]